MRIGGVLLCCLILGLFQTGFSLGDNPAPAVAPPSVEIPEQQEVVDLLKNEPFSLENWPVWKTRLLSWINDKSHQTDSAFDAAALFIDSQASLDQELPASLANDSLAWYLYGRHNLNVTNRRIIAENAYRKSIELDPTFARAHRNLAIAILLGENDMMANVPRITEANASLAKAKELDPSLELDQVLAQTALMKKDFGTAEKLYTKLWQADSNNTELAYAVAACIMQNKGRTGSYAEGIAPLVEKAPQEAQLRCIYAFAFAADDEPRKAVEQLKIARSLGVEPSEVLGPDLINTIEEMAKPSWLETLGWFYLGFAGIYLLIMAVMASTGLILAGWTRGKSALHLLQDQPLHVVAKGQVARTVAEPLLARFYAVALMAGLAFFYLALPFVVVGVLATTGGLIWLIFQANRIPVKLVVLIVVVGLAMAWAVIKSMFPRFGSGNFGIKKTKEECPQLFAAIEEVASRVDTPPITDIYIGPGWEFGVHEETRGPFGIFGTKGRVLTVGLAAMKYLTIDEMKSILAHEYAHFSHRDTFFSRFIRRVDVSIGTALGGMADAGGLYNYVNPFYWFLWLYYKAYSLLSAGYSRSREFLADRMACSLYGANVFHAALRKVCTDGPLFEKTMYPTVTHLLSEGKSFTNMYEVFSDYRTNEETTEQRVKVAEELERERGSLFASHPSFRERIDATAAWPHSNQNDERVAMSLFEDAPALELELTEFLTAVLLLAQQEQAAAAMQNT